MVFELTLYQTTKAQSRRGQGRALPFVSGWGGSVGAEKSEAVRLGAVVEGGSRALFP